jgi:DNA replication protein DnaC
VDALRQYGDNIEDEVAQGNGIVLFGPSGGGKDHLLIGLARAAIKARLKVDWDNGQDLYGRFRDAMGSNEPEFVMVREYTAPDVLILSDPLPPQGSLTDFQSATLFRILDARYRICRPTWVTLNVASGAEAESRMGVSLVDRLRHGSLCVWCNWPSYRKPRTIGKEDNHE